METFSLINIVVVAVLAAAVVASAVLHTRLLRKNLASDLRRRSSGHGRWRA
ncbi:hypothetical protein J8I26_09095 [Herbaspirillum sp. LeCh32-8]|uniref:hypothetical protein n=1 Tax=Herbaspirillum sp. LeCh32-8 TaxID=2821356 RepID=UPI001AE94AFA|nr:hypothetical protein [Herbaspirillum sp. LeCh32-8]MBP0598257.1 hypothetical protein [Herbaspirillum sp. LeCh32-8]